MIEAISYYMYINPGTLLLRQKCLCYDAVRDLSQDPTLTGRTLFFFATAVLSIKSRYCSPNNLSGHRYPKRQRVNAKRYDNFPEYLDLDQLGHNAFYLDKVSKVSCLAK